MSDRYWEIWNEGEQARIDADIERNRKADGEFVVESAPVGTEVSVEQLDHEFRFGAHVFNFNQLGKKEYNDAYKASYGKGGIFNQATVAFYWNRYEPEPGRLRACGDYEDSERFWNSLSREEAMKHPFWRRPAPGPVVEYLRRRGVAVHGHVLVWGCAKPLWIYDAYCPEDEKRAFDRLGIPRNDGPDSFGGNLGGAYQTAWTRAWGNACRHLDEREIAALAPTFAGRMRKIFRKRVFDVARAFGETVDSWDVVNESSKDWLEYRRSRTGLPVWKSCYGLMPGDYPLHALQDAKEAFSENVRLAVNDWNVGAELRDQVADLLREGAKVDLVGCQMHIFDTNVCRRLSEGESRPNWTGAWATTPELIRERLDTMATLGRSIHVSEVTIAAPGVTERDRMIQAILVRNIYRVWFSHPRTMGVTWWNTVDGGGARGEPLVSGLFDPGMRKKPAYHAIDQLVNHEWKTRTKSKVEVVNGMRMVRFRGFRGRYRLSWTDALGTEHEKLVDLTGERTSDVDNPVCETLVNGLGKNVRYFDEVTVYGPVKQPFDTAKTAAEAEKLAPSRKVRCEGGGALDLGAVTGVKCSEFVGDPPLAAYVCARVESPVDQTVRFYWTNDWYGELFVNGSNVCKMFGESEWCGQAIRLRAGWNEILFRSRPGSSGSWKAALAIDRVSR